MAKVSEKEGCRGCPMAKLQPDAQFVDIKPGDGLRLLIGEAAGEQEALENEPFVGGAGAWLNAIFKGAGINRDNVTIVNCIQCHPPQNIFPTDADARKYISQDDAYKAVAQCQREHVEPILKARPWNRIDLMGAKPLQLVAKKDGGIEKWRGSPLSIPALGTELKAIATYHPAYIMRDQKMLPVVINDLRKGLTPPPENYILYPSLQQVQDFKATEFAFDLETSYTKERDIKMVGLCAKPTEAMVVPFAGAYIPELKRIFTNATLLIGQNIVQFDVPILFKALEIEWKL